MAKVRLSVSVQDSHLKKLSAIAKAARKAGMKVEQQLESIGVLTGSIDADKIGGLHKIAGIANVEKEREVKVPPSDSPVQ